MVRWIKLKEYDLSIDRHVEASDEYAARCDETFERGPFRVRADAFGFVRSAAPALNEACIIILGDSVPETLYLGEDFRLGAVIERKLRAAGRLVDVLMGGTSSCTTLHALNVYMNKCIPLSPKCVIYMSCGSDSEALCYEGKYWSSDKRLGPIAQHGQTSRESYTWLPDTSHRTAMLKVLREATVSHQTELFLVTVPHRRRVDNYLERLYNGNFTWHDRIVAMKEAVNACTREFAIDHSVPCIDAEMFSDSSNLFYDIAHLNKLGSEVIGDLIAGELIRKSQVGVLGVGAK